MRTIGSRKRGSVVDNRHYVLRGREVVPVNLETWARSMEGADCRVALDEIGDKRVSTVFLGLNHQYGDGPPLLFETMVFPADSSSAQYCDRYSTYDEAEAGHKRTVEALQAGTLELYNAD